jgi:hypothetical protein
MNATGCNAGYAVELESLPDDLRTWLTDADLANEAARLAASSHGLRMPVSLHREAPEALCALILHCFAAHYCGSEEVQWAAAEDARIREFHPHIRPDAVAARQFRTLNREAIRAGLVCLAKTALERNSSAAPKESISTAARADILEWADSKLTLASMLDAAAWD